ncbi:hypothetical protein [Pseudomonas sp. OHS18]|uniref:hypothetical protein n=1 Tax=Pseudomonas sp. OHS18 TaxID=3399679 RepID=UPI003A86CE9D
MLVDEGKNSHFVHASVQEFFAARYIKNRTDIVASKFYGQVLNGKWGAWGEELSFLKQIDPYRSFKYFYIPDLQRSLDYLMSGKPAVDSDVVANYLSSLGVIKRNKVVDGRTNISYVVDKQIHFNTYHMNALSLRVFTSMFAGYPHDARIKPWTAGFDSNPECVTRSYKEIADDRGNFFKDDLYSKVSIFINEFYRDSLVMQDFVRRQEDQTDFIDIS